MSISFVALAFIFGELFLMASKRFETEIRAQVVTEGPFKFMTVLEISKRNGPIVEL